MDRKDANNIFSYAVTAQFEDASVRAEFIAWLSGGHVAEVVRLGRAVSAEVVVHDDGLVQARYVFPDRATFDAYASGPAVQLRAQGLQRFSPSRGVMMSRSTGEIVHHV